MANNNSAVNIQVLADAPGVNVASFGVPMIAGACAMSERIRFYENSADALADQQAGDISQAQYDAVAAGFAQAQTPSQIAVGRIEADVAQVNTVTVGGTIANGLVYTITINGTPFAYTAVVPTDDNDAVATALRSAINGGSEPVTASGAGAAIILTADVAGTPFTIAVSATGAGTLTNVATTPNANVATELAAILAANAGWYSFGLVSRTDLDILRAAAWVESNNRIFGAQTSSATALAGTAGNILLQLQALAYTRTFPMWYSGDAIPACFAWTSFKTAADLDTRATAWAHAPLVGVVADDEEMTSTERLNILNAGGNVYLTLDGVGVTFNGKMAGGAFIDITTTVDWYGARVREALTQELINASARNSKIPYNDQGFSVIGNAVDGVNGRAVRAAHLNDGTTFVNLPLRSTLSSGNVTARNYPFTFGGQLTSAVLTITGTGYVSDDGVAIALLASA